MVITVEILNVSSAGVAVTVLLILKVPDATVITSVVAQLELIVENIPTDPLAPVDHVNAPLILTVQLTLTDLPVPLILMENIAHVLRLIQIRQTALEEQLDKVADKSHRDSMTWTVD